MDKDYESFTECDDSSAAYGISAIEYVPYPPPARGFRLVETDVVMCPTREARDAAWRLLTGEGL